MNTRIELESIQSSARALREDAQWNADLGETRANEILLAELIERLAILLQRSSGISKNETERTTSIRNATASLDREPEETGTTSLEDLYHNTLTWCLKEVQEALFDSTYKRETILSNLEDRLAAVLKQGVYVRTNR